MQEQRDLQPTLRQLILETRYPRWSIAAQLLRFPSFMSAFGFVLASLYVTGNQNLGGLMVAVYVACTSLFAAPVGRWVDALGATLGLSLFALLRGLIFCVMALVEYEKGSTTTLLVLSGFAGALTSGGMRTLLNSVVPKSMVRMALSLDASIVEVTVATAPLIVAAAATLSQAFAIIPMAVSSFAGAIVVWTFRRHISSNQLSERESTRESGVTIPKSSRDQPKPASRGFLWKNRQFWFWLVVEFSFGQVFGTVETAIVPWSIHVGAGAGKAGIALTILSVCSGLGGLMYMKVFKTWTSRARVETLCLFSLVVAGSLVLGVSNHWIIGVAGMAIIGLCTAPLNVVISDAASDCMPHHRQSEGFAVLSAIYTAGYGLGGLLLAVLPLHQMMLSAVGTGVIALLTAPLIARGTGWHDPKTDPQGHKSEQPSQSH